MTTLAPYNWLRKIPAELKALDAPLLFGYTPAFDERKFITLLSESLKLEDLKLQIKPFDLKEASNLQEGFEASDTFFIRVAPFQGQVALLIPKGNFDLLLAQFAGKELHHYILDPEFKKAFSEFVLLEALSAFQGSFGDRSISPQLLSEGKIPEEAAWTKDFELTWDQGSVVCRLILPAAFRESWQSKYKQKEAASNKLLEKIQIEVHIEAGRVQLERKLWKTLQKGDYLVLDSCHLQPKVEKGRVILSVNHTPAFRARIKDGSIKILEYPLFHEVGTTMTPPKDEEEMRDEELDEDFEGEDSEEYIEEEEEEEEVEEESETQSEASAAPSQKEAGSPTQQAKIPQKPFRADDIPLDIIIEAGRFQMTVQKLSELQPGNLIDLDIHPDEGVDLVVNGVCIAKGELLKVGDTLGVRILDIAK